jgi:signal-transduction protein with cAMP-binding, CBS, and nucleotidyltransferase domain
MKDPMNTTRDIARELARKYSTMTHDELDTLESILVPMKFAKGDMILKEGEICRDIYYIDKGLIRQFYFKKDKEVTEHLGVDRTIFMCIESLFKESPTRLQVEALENTFIYALPKQNLEIVALHNVNIQILYRKILEESAQSIFSGGQRGNRREKEGSLFPNKSRGKRNVQGGVLKQNTT